jgi:hypothetical protein
LLDISSSEKGEKKEVHCLICALAVVYVSGLKFICPCRTLFDVLKLRATLIFGQGVPK